MAKFDVSRALLSIGAVFLRPDEPFTWASGIKSPIYCDNRLILTAPEVRDGVENALAEMIRREFPEAEALMGTATAGIAHAAIAAHILGLPMGYVRSGSKDHGRRNRIEGRLAPGEKVVVVEDLISTGGQRARGRRGPARGRGRGAGHSRALHLRHGKGQKAHSGAQYRRAVCLTNFDEVVAAAAADGAFPASYVPALMAFRDNPDDGAWQEALK